MTVNRKWRRLDQILMEENAITEDEMLNALSRQRHQGGRIGMHLLLMGYIDEATLVKALARQSNCNGVILTGLEIPPEVLSFVPARLAISRKVLPFDYKPEENALNVACETPLDEELIQELLFAARGKRIKLYVAAELPLINAIAHYYMGMEVSPERPFIELPPFEFEAKDKASERADPLNLVGKSPGNHTLILSNDSVISDSLTTILEYDNYRVETCDSVESAREWLETANFDALVIRESPDRNDLTLLNRLRRLSPKTSVRQFKKSSDLLLQSPLFSEREDISVKNLQLLASLLDSKERQKPATAESVGSLVEQLCRWMNLQSNDYLIITTAAYLSGLSRHYYDSCRVFSDRKTAIDMSSRMLEALNYPSIIIDILGSTYLELTEQYSTHLPLHILGGNIITIADQFLSIHPETEKLTLYRLEQSRERIKALEGNILLSEVISSFFEMLVTKISDKSADRPYNQVLMYSEESVALREIEERLRQEGFRTITESDIDCFVELCTRSMPDTIVLLCPGEKDETLGIVRSLGKRGLDFPLLPTVVLTRGELVTNPEPLFQLGVDRVLPCDDRINLLGSLLRQRRESVPQSNTTQNACDETDQPFAAAETH